jgi:hypothetical protein
MSAASQVPADDQALDLVGALEDLHDCGLQGSFRWSACRLSGSLLTRPVVLAAAGFTLDLASVTRRTTMVLGQPSHGP